VRAVRSGKPVPVTRTGRQLVARRLEAPTLRSLAQQTGMSYAHLRGVANANEPTTTDARDLAVALNGVAS
jgi:hypothetical protein